MKLSRYESSVLDLFLLGFSYPEIANKLGKTDRSIYNAIQRIREKLVELL
jgi:RNA polymerase sporulation-specific sigma factor